MIVTFFPLPSARLMAWLSRSDLDVILPHGNPEVCLVLGVTHTSNEALVWCPLLTLNPFVHNNGGQGPGPFVGLSSRTLRLPTAERG